MHPFKDEGVNKQLIHRGAVTRLAQTLDQNILFSAGEDGSLFVFKISEEKIKDEREQVEDFQQVTANIEQEESEREALTFKVMDKELANIVLVKKHEMEKWLARQEKLTYDLESTKRKVESKLAECRKRYDV